MGQDECPFGPQSKSQLLTELLYFGNLNFNASLSACKGFDFLSNVLSPWKFFLSFFFNVKIKTCWLHQTLQPVNNRGAARNGKIALFEMAGL